MIAESSSKSSSVATVAAPVIWEEADFSLPIGNDPLQAGLLRRIAHVLHNPLQQLRRKKVDINGGDATKRISLFYCIKQPNNILTHLLISATKVGLVPLKYLTESHFFFPRIHHAGVIVLQEGLSSCSKLAVNILMEQI